MNKCSLFDLYIKNSHKHDKQKVLAKILVLLLDYFKIHALLIKSWPSFKGSQGLLISFPLITKVVDEPPSILTAL